MVNKKTRKRGRVALIGYGFWGQNLARVLNEMGVLATICDSSLKACQSAGKVYRKLKITDAIQDIADDPNIDGVLIATPPSSHGELAIAMLQAGKHAFVEKPLALSVRDGLDIVAAAKKFKRLLMVGHVLEYHPAVTKLKSLLAGRQLGQIQYVYAQRLNFGRIGVEENALWNFAPHDVALLLRFLKKMPVRVNSSGHASIHGHIEDSTVTMLDFPNGVKAHMFVSWLHPFKVQRLVIVGNKQMAVFDDTKPWPEKLLLYKHRVDWVSGYVPVAREAKGTRVKLTPKEPLKVECEHFISCIRNGKPPLSNGENAIEVLKVLEAAQRSHHEKGAPVYIEAMEDEKASFTDCYIHPTATIDKGVQIQTGVKIWHYTHIMPGAQIGKNCILGQNCFVGGKVKIGNNCKIQNNVSVYEGVELDDYVFCGPSMVFTNDLNPRSTINKKEFLKTKVCRGATLGANSTVICGITIGRFAFIAAHAVVTKDIPDYALVVGSPGKVMGWMCECAVHLEFKNKSAVCKSCKKKYKQISKNKVLKIK